MSKLKQIFSPDNIFFFGLILLAIGMPVSHFLMSISQFILGFAWIISGNYKKKLDAFFKNKAALVLCGLYLLHILGLIYSSDYAYAFKDLRIKLPLLTLPFLIASYGKIEPKRYRIVLDLFITAVFASTLVSVAVLLGFTDRHISNARDLSVFISAIRFSLMISLSIFLLICRLYLTWNEHGFLHKLSHVLLILWFLVFMIILESMTGLIITFIIGGTLLFYGIWLFKSRTIKVAFLCLIMAVVTGVVFLLTSAIKDENIIKSYPGATLKTAMGNDYDYFKNIDELENGYPVWAFISSWELGEAWSKRSRIGIDGKDERNQLIRYTLIRFLTSKGLKKDAEGVKKLSNSEVRAIEKGIANVKYQNITSLNTRIHTIVWELKRYMKGRSPSGHSVSQRMEFWKAATGIVIENPIIGVGTGDINAAFDDQYEKVKSKLAPEWRLKSHNQYLTIAVLFGFIGLAYFIFLLVTIFRYEQAYKNFHFLIFFIIAVLSMFTEDTLETQAGVTFFAFWMSFLLFQKPEKNPA